MPYSRHIFLIMEGHRSIERTKYSQLPDAFREYVGNIDYRTKEHFEMINLGRSGRYLGSEKTALWGVPPGGIVGNNSTFGGWQFPSVYCCHMVVLAFDAMPTSLSFTGGSGPAYNYFIGNGFSLGNIVVAGVLQTTGNMYFLGPQTANVLDSKFYFVFPAGASLSLTLASGGFNQYPNLYLYAKPGYGAGANVAISSNQYSLIAWDGCYRYGKVSINSYLTSANNVGAHLVYAKPYAYPNINSIITSNWVGNGGQIKGIDNYLFSMPMPDTQSVSNWIQTYQFEGLLFTPNVGVSGANLLPLNIVVT